MTSESHRRWEALPDALKRLATEDPKVRQWVRAYKAQLLTKDALFDLAIDHLTK